MKRGLSEILKYNIASFVYRDGFSEVSPAMLCMLGYSESDLKSRVFGDLIENYEDTSIAKTMSDEELMKTDGSIGDSVVFKDASGCPVGGYLNVQWRGGGKSVFGYFFPLLEIGLDGKSPAAEKISDMSLSAYVEVDEDFNILEADKGFRFYFDLENDPEGRNLAEIKGLSELCAVLKSDGCPDCFTVRCGSDELVAVVNRSAVRTDIRLYGREFLLYSRFPYSLPSIQARRLIWDGAPIAMLIDPVKGIIVEANKSAAGFYGYGVEELRGMPLANINTLPLDVLGQELEMAASGVKRFFVFRERTSDGSIKNVNVTAAPVELFGKTYVFAFIVDITRRKHLERIIEEKNRTLTELNTGLSKMFRRETENRKKQEQLFMQQAGLTAIGRMVGAVAHNWRQPLNTVGLIVQDLEEAYSRGELDEKYVSESVRKVMDQLHNMSQSIDNFRGLFKPRAEKNFFDVKEAVSEVINLMGTQLKDHSVVIRMDCVFCGKTPDCRVESDGEGCPAGNLFALGYVNEFKQIIINILNNSLDAISARLDSGRFSEIDEGVVSVNIEKDGEYISIAIDDNGGGLGDADASRAFEPYFTTKRDSFGMGLYAAKNFIESSMNGSVSIENLEDGCRVSIKIPYREERTV